MRRAGVAITAQDQSDNLLDALQRHRDHHFRRIRSRRVTGEKSALDFIDQVGFCAAFTAGLGIPCLREAISGEREPVLPEHIQHDYAIGMTWRLKDSIAERRLAYYGKVLAGRPSFIATEMLGAFLRLRLKAGGYLALYRDGHLSHCAKLIMDALSKRGPAETKALKLSSGYAQARNRGEFDRAMKELQEKFLALKVEERYEPFTYVWDTMAHRWPDAISESRELTAREAAYRVVRRHFEIAGFASERALGRVLAIDAKLVDAATHRLDREKIISRNRKIAGLTGSFAILREYDRAAQ